MSHSRKYSLIYDEEQIPEDDPELTQKQFSDYVYSGHSTTEPEFPFWVLKISQFLDAGATSTLIVYIGLYFKYLDFNNTTIGFLFATHCFGCFIGSLIWSHLADLRISIIFIFTLLWIFGSASTLLLLVPFIYNTLSLLFCVVFVNGLMVAAVQCLLDGVTIQVVVGQEEENYGKNRLWGSLGWGFTSLLSALFIDEYGYAVIFIGYVLISFFNLVLIIAYFPHSVNHTTEEVNLKRLFTPDIGFLLLHMFILAHFMAFIEIFLYIYFVNELGTSNFFVGTCVFFMTLTEVVVFWYGKDILNEIGYTNAFLIALFIYIARVPFYAFMGESWKEFAYFSEALHGVTFALAWVAAVELGSQLAPDNLQNTMQALVLAFYLRAGFGSGTIIFGILYDNYSAKTLFIYSSVLLYVWCFIVMMGDKYVVNFNIRDAFSRKLLGETTSIKD